MKLSYYIKKLQELEKTYPNAVMVFEENGEFKKVKYTPTEGYFTQGDGVITESKFSTNYDKYEVNAVSIN